jgi:hypothetical protein
MRSERSWNGMSHLPIGISIRLNFYLVKSFTYKLLIV